MQRKPELPIKSAERMAGPSFKHRERPGPKKIFYRALLWAAAIGILVWLFVKIPPGQLLDAFKKTDPLLFGAAVVGFTVLTLLLDAVAHLWVLRRFNPPISFRQVFASRGESYLLLSLGFLYGQGGMAYSISKRTLKPLGEVTGSLLFLMFNNLLALMLFPTISLIFLINRVMAPDFRQSQEFATLLWWLGISWTLSVLLIVFFARDWDNPLRRRLKRGVVNAFDRARTSDYAVALSLRGVQVVNWCVFTWLGLMAFDVGLSFPMLLLLGPVIAMAAVIPTPGRMGTSQGAWILMFGHLEQVNEESLLAFSLMWTIIVNILRWLIGAASLAANRRYDKIKQEQ